MPPSETSNITTAYLKLELSRSAESPSNWEDCAHQQECLVSDLFGRHYRVTKDGERLRLSGEFETPFYETTFKVESSNGFDQKLLATAEEYMQRILLFPRPSRATLVLHSPELFHQSLLSTKTNIKTNKIIFGNLHNNLFFGHWETSFRPKNNSSEKSPVLHELRTSFHFDKAKPVTVEFWTEEDVEVGKARRKTTEKQKTQYCLCIEDNAIHRVIVDAVLPHIKRVYFVLNVPVRIMKAHQTGREIRMKKRPRHNRTLELQYGKECPVASGPEVLAENNVFCVEFGNDLELYAILSRLKHRWNTPIAFAKFDEVCNLIMPTPDNSFAYPQAVPIYESAENSVYRFWMKQKTTDGRRPDPFGSNDPDFHGFINYLFPHPRAQYGVRNKAADKMNERKFTFVYLITALLSRGAVVKDQLLTNRDNWCRFLTLIEMHLHDDENYELCESALEDLINHVDQQPTRVGDLIETFRLFCERRQQTRISNQITTEQWDDGFRKIRKVLLTPTRLLFMIPETIMSNRAVNGGDHDGTRIVRVSFRDDNGQPMRTNLLKGIMGQVVMKHLTFGFSIMNREYGFLGASNSQMREGGAYFMERYNPRDAVEKFPNGVVPHTFKPKIHEFRNKLGKFEDAGSIPKAMARLGQCFTQARPCNGCEIGTGDYRMVFDIVGGKNGNGEPYTFSDGIGLISMQLMTKIAKLIKLTYVPSAIQFRYRGMKGMMAVDPAIDETAEYFRRLYRQKQIIGQQNMTGNELIDLAPWTLQCLFRESQLKFKNSRGKQDKWPIELVKWSSPTPVTLNRPFISILDHVSALQSIECHRRICGRIEELLDIQMDSFAKSMFNEKSCRAKLEDIPRRVYAPALSENIFTLSTEPFFRSLIKAVIDMALVRLLAKIQIQIPTNLGRTMYGVIDETGQLQYGQVYIQYSSSLNTQNGGRSSTITHKGPVLITKFPSVVAGDVRMFEAVDIPELAHLQNVVVFPQSGSRAHPDEMAGSDLDGDEYAVIWDPQLFLDRNETAFEYNSKKPSKYFSLDQMDTLMHTFYAEYMELDSVGHISINHLYQSDQFGIQSNVCNTLAVKNSMALDFAKSGVAPPPLTSTWYRNKTTDQMEPPERSERSPDFALTQYRPISNPMYTSSRLLGTLFRELKCVNDVVMQSVDKLDVVDLDPLITVDGWEEFAASAEAEMGRYNAQLRSIMDYYGIRTEAEVFSGCFREIRNRISNREQDDMSLYNTEYIIETKMTDLYKKFRENFFVEFANTPCEKAFMKFTSSTNRYDDSSENVLKRICREPSDRMMAKATAYYKVCYNAVAQGGERKLSFAWIAYDILNFVKTRQVLALNNVPEVRHPQMKTIRSHRHSFLEDHHARFSEFLARIVDNNSTEEHEAKAIIAKYLSTYPNLDKCMFIIENWARETELLVSKADVTRDNERNTLKMAAESRLQWYHVSLLVIMFATNQLGSLSDVQTFDRPILELLEQTKGSIATQRELTENELDQLTLSFFKYLSSRRFYRLKSLNFNVMGLSSVFMRGEWIAYHKIAVRTYYNLLLNQRFEELPVSTDPTITRQSLLREGVPFVVDLPKGIDIEFVVKRLKQKMKCTDIAARIDTEFSRDTFDRLLISSRGTLDRLQELREFVSFKMPRYIWQMDRSISGEIANLIYNKITSQVWKPPAAAE